jgi:hypothetical protein
MTIGVRTSGTASTELPWTAGVRAGVNDLESKVTRYGSDLSKGDQDRLHDQLGHL